MVAGLLRGLEPLRVVLLLSLLCITAHTRAQSDAPAEAAAPEAALEVEQAQLIDPLRLSDGWWDLLQPEDAAGIARVVQWSAQLEQQSETAAPEVALELTRLLDNLRQLTQPGKDVEALPASSEPPIRLSGLLQAVVERYQLEELVAAASARIRLDRSLATNAEIRTNQGRLAYIESSPEAEQARALLGWRWMRLWSSQRLAERQAAVGRKRLDQLQEALDQAEQFSDVSVSKLLHEETDEAQWAELAAAGQDLLAQAMETESLTSETALNDLAKSADLRAQHVDAQVAQQALWLVQHFRGTAATEPTPELTAKPDAAIAWQDEAKRLLNDRRARVISAIDNVGSDAASSEELQHQLEEIRGFSGALRGLDIALTKNALLAQQIEITAGLSLKSVGSFWSQASRRTSVFTDKALSRTLFHLKESPVTGGMLLRMLLIFAIVWGISKIIGRAVRRLERRHNISAAAAFMFNRVLHYILILLGMLIALSSIGIDLTKFALFASALGIGLGFGLQAVISNFVSGLIILFERSLKIGDFVELESGVRGKVREINTRGTIITTNDNIDILIPNSEFVNGKVTNWTLRDVVRRLRIPFGVAYGSDKELVKKAVLEAADAVPFTLQDETHKTQVWLSEFGDSSLNFHLIVWVSGSAVSRPSAVSAAYAWAIETALGKYNIEIPFPQQDLNVRSYFGLTGKAAIDAVVGRTEIAEVRAPQPAALTYRERRELGSNDAAEETLRAIEQEEQEKADAEKHDETADEQPNEQPLGEAVK